MGRLARRIRAHWRKRHRKREALRTSREFFKRQHTLRRWRLPKQNSSDITPFTGAPSSRTTPAPPKHGLLDSLLPSRKTTDARSTHTGTARQHSVQRVNELLVCLHLSEATGSALSATLRRAAEHAEESIDALLGRESALAAPRATGRILSLLPFIGLGLGELMGTSPVSVLTGSIAGACAGLVGVGLALAGRRWTAALVHAAETETF